MKEQRLAVAVTCQFRIESPLDTEGFHAHGERVMDELMNLEDCNPELTDSGVGTDSAERTIRIGVLVFGDDQDTATQRASTLIRTAIHAAGGATPHWAPIASPELATDVEYDRPSVTVEPALIDA